MKKDEWLDWQKKVIYDEYTKPIITRSQLEKEKLDFHIEKRDNNSSNMKHPF